MVYRTKLPDTASVANSQGDGRLLSPSAERNSAPIIGLIKFNKYTQCSKRKLIPLGGIKLTNLGRLKFINSEGFAVLSEIKKKPVKIINRLF